MRACRASQAWCATLLACGGLNRYAPACCVRSWLLSGTAWLLPDGCRPARHFRLSPACCAAFLPSSILPCMRLRAAYALACPLARPGWRLTAADLRARQAVEGAAHHQSYLALRWLASMPDSKRACHKSSGDATEALSFVLC